MKRSKTPTSHHRAEERDPDLGAALYRLLEGPDPDGFVRRVQDAAGLVDERDAPPLPRRGITTRAGVWKVLARWAQPGFALAMAAGTVLVISLHRNGANPRAAFPDAPAPIDALLTASATPDDTGTLFLASDAAPPASVLFGAPDGR